MLFGRVDSRVKGRRVLRTHDGAVPAQGASALPRGPAAARAHRPGRAAPHLSGPLGTMVGLYEAADRATSATRTVDGRTRGRRSLLDRDGAPGARADPRALRAPRWRSFRRAGIDEGENFFARVDTQATGRALRRRGAPGALGGGARVRTYATLLRGAQKHLRPRRGNAEQPADPYMTLVGYFNSLRELGGMRRLVEDEVRNRVARIQQRARYRRRRIPGPANRACEQTGELPRAGESRRGSRTTKEPSWQRRHASKDETAASTWCSHRT